MASQLPNEALLSESEIQLAAKFHFGIVIAQWNAAITYKLRDGALKVLAGCGVGMDQINILQVPGAFELPLAAKWLVERAKTDAVICLGCIIKGETKHDEYIAQSVSNGIMNLNLSEGKPVIFGVLTVNNSQQAQDRSDGIYGNKGEEAAITAIKMLCLKRELID